MILRGTSKKYKYLGENEIKNETILTHWSVGQAGSNDEKNWGSKISLDCPFKDIFLLCVPPLVQTVAFLFYGTGSGFGSVSLFLYGRRSVGIFSFICLVGYNS